MRLLLILSFFLVLPFTVLAQSKDLCKGTDLIDALSVTEKHSLKTLVDQTAYPKGLLWRAEREDVTLTIFGTYHIEMPQTADHLKALTTFINEANDVLLEISPPDMRALEKDIAEDPSLMFLTTGETLPELLGPKDWPRYAEEMAARQFPGVISSQFKPSWAAMMLGISPCEVRSGALAGEGIDKRIGKSAEALAKRVHSLENYRTVLTLLDDFPQSEQLKMIRMFLDWSPDADDLSYTLRKSYLAGNIGEIMGFAELHARDTDTLAELADFNDRLLTQRNRNWITFIEALDISGPVFVAVGAAHLPGETGLLKLLAEAGYTITRLPFTP